MTIAESSFPPGRPGVGAAPSNLLDPADGIARVMGDRALYLRILRRFRDDYQDGAARIRAAVGSGDARLAHRMAHTLKGASGMICAPTLHRLAGVLEHDLRGGAANPNQAIDAVKAALAELMPAIATMLDADAEPGGTPATQASVDLSGERLVDRLAGLLASGDGAAVDLVEGSGAMLTAALGEAGFSALALAVSEFDFVGALETLRQGEQSRRTAAER
ncbi:MAG: phosphotransfer protein [Massilia sp.]|nr:phosphotransfer protein [Massilia sp.]